MLAEEEGMTLCLAQLMAYLADDVKLQNRIFSKPGLKSVTGIRYPITSVTASAEFT